MKSKYKYINIMMMAFFLIAAIAGGKTINVNAVAVVNNPPVAYPKTVTVTAGESIEITFEGSDVDGDPLFLYYIDNTTKGTLYDSDNLNATMYFAWASSSGVDSFHIVASDGQSLSEPALVTINIVPVITNHAPKTYNNFASTNEDTVVTAPLFATDPDGDPLTYSIETGPLHGILSGSGPSLSYTPDPDFNGTDSFTYSVSDGQLTSNVSTFFLTVLPVNDAPVADPQSVTLTAGEDKAITLTGSDVDEDPLSYMVVSNPVNGSLSGTAPALVYTPNAGYSGPDSFTFKVNDGVLDSIVATVSITVTSPQPATIFFDDFETNQGWVRNPNGTDQASKGMWKQANPESVRILGKYTQLGSTVSGSYDLVTGNLAGNMPTRHDVDGGVTTIRSPRITLPAGRNLTISFSYYFAHLANSSAADYLKVKIIGATTNTILQELGNRKNDYAAWAAFSGDLSSYAGQSIYIQIECADMAGESLVEAAIDDVLIIAQ